MPHGSRCEHLRIAEKAAKHIVLHVLATDNGLVTTYTPLELHVQMQKERENERARRVAAKWRKGLVVAQTTDDSLDSAGGTKKVPPSAFENVVLALLVGSKKKGQKKETSRPQAGDVESQLPGKKNKVKRRPKKKTAHRVRASGKDGAEDDRGVSSSDENQSEEGLGSATSNCTNNGEDLCKKRGPGGPSYGRR